MEDLIFSNKINDVTSGNYDHYVVHIYCKKGNGRFKFANRDFEFKQGDFLIWTYVRLVSNIEITKDIEVTIFYVSRQFTTKHTPNNNYGIFGNFSLLQNPILHLMAPDQTVCEQSLKNIETRLKDDDHHFHNELLGALTVALILDLYNIHYKSNNKTLINDQPSILLNQFINHLSSGIYKTRREVSYYADLLNITPKYLTEVCKKISGHSATFWIDRFVTTEIVQLLKSKNLTLTEIKDQLNFNSLSYFSRYTKKLLGVSPTEFRLSESKKPIT